MSTANDNKRPASNTFAVVWCMCEVGAFILGIATAIMTGNPYWGFLSVGAFALMMGGV